MRFAAWCLRVMSRWSNGRDLDLPNLFDKITLSTLPICSNEFNLYVSLGVSSFAWPLLFLLRFFKMFWQEGFLFGQSLVHVFYHCVSLTLERFEACGAPCAKPKTRTSWSWSHLFDGWDPSIPKIQISRCFMCVICAYAQVEWSSKILQVSGFRCSRLWHGGRVPPLQRRWVSGLQLHLCMIYGCYSTCSSCYHKISWMPRSAPLYEKTWVGEMMNWGSKLPIYNQTKLGLKCHQSVAWIIAFIAEEDGNDAIGTRHQCFLFFCITNAIRTTSSTLNGLNPGAGLYTVKGQQTKLGEPTDVKITLCDHFRWPLYVSSMRKNTMGEYFVHEHHVWTLYGWALHGSRRNLHSPHCHSHRN